MLVDDRNMTPFVILKRKKLLKGKLPNEIIFQCNEQGRMTWNTLSNSYWKPGTTHQQHF